MRLTVGSVVALATDLSCLGFVQRLTVTDNVEILPLSCNMATRLPIDALVVVAESPRWDFTYGDSVRIDAPWLAGGIFKVVGVSPTIVTVESHDGLTFNYARESVHRV